MDNKTLDKYARLAIRIGVNLQKGEMLVVNAPVSAQKSKRSLNRLIEKVREMSRSNGPMKLSVN